MADVDTADLLIVGAGPGGFAAAVEAARLGAAVTLVDPGEAPPGSAALASRALAAAASRAEAMRSAAAFGIVGEEPRINHRRVHEHVAEAVAGIAPDHSFERLAALGVTVIRGTARLTDRSTVLVGEQRLRARHIVIAAGARPVVPQIPGLGDIPYFTAETVVHNSRKLSHLLVLGNGPVALELAQAHRRLGSEVTLVDPAPLLPGFDPELVEVALRRLREEGVTLLEQANVIAIRPRSQGIGVLVRAGEGEEQALDVSHVLVAGARRPDLDALDLARAGVARGPDGALLLSAGLRTRNARIYAVGEALGGGVSTHAAIAQGRAVARHALLGAPLRAAALAGPRIVHIEPQLAEIGVLHIAGRAGGQVLRIGLAETDRARVERRSYGLVKARVDGAGRILGAGIVGAGADETIALFSLAMSARLTLADLAGLVPAWPSLAEAVQRLAAQAREGTAASPAERRRLALFRRLPWR